MLATSQNRNRANLGCADAPDSFIDLPRLPEAPHELSELRVLLARQRMQQGYYDRPEVIDSAIEKLVDALR